MPEFAAFTAMFGFKATLWGFAILFSIGTLGFLAVWFMLEAQLQEKEESLLTKESAISQLQENSTAKVQELEHRLTKKEDLTGLLEQRTAEITNLRSESQTRVGMLEAQLQEKEESLLTKESAISQLQENFTAKVQELEHRLTEEEEQMFLPRNKWREL